MDFLVPGEMRGAVRSLIPVLALALAGCFYEPYARLPERARQNPPLTRGEVERLAAAGISEAVESRGAQRLVADDIVALKSAGAGEKVIRSMISHERSDPAPDEWEGAPATRRRYYRNPGFGFGYSRWGFSSGFGIQLGW